MQEDPPPKRYRVDWQLLIQPTLAESSLAPFAKLFRSRELLDEFVGALEKIENVKNIVISELPSE